MPHYVYRYKSDATGRARSGKRRAYDESELRASLATESIEPISIDVVPDELATERQVAYIKDLGGSPGEGLTKAEASDLIDTLTNRSAPIGEYERGVAAYYRVETSRFASKGALYRKITAQLNTDADARLLASWFVFRVYRTNCRRGAGEIRSPGDERLQAVAETFVKDDQAVRSLKRVAESSSLGFRWFGQFTAPNGALHEGESSRTAAFIAAHAALAAAGLVPQAVKADRKVGIAIRRERAPQGVAENPSPIAAQKSGCLPVLLLMLAFGAGLPWVF